MANQWNFMFLNLCKNIYNINDKKGSTIVLCKQEIDKQFYF
jgi:hypothetical protein